MIYVALWTAVSVTALVVCFILPERIAAALDRACRLWAAHRLGIPPLDDTSENTRNRLTKRNGAETHLLSVNINHRRNGSI